MGQTANWTAPRITQITADTSYAQFQAALPPPVPKPFKFGVSFIARLNLDTIVFNLDLNLNFGA